MRATGHVREVFDRRDAPGRGLADSAGAIARACHAMSERFHRGGRLFTFGNGGAATDAQHIAVEFVHPVIVGKRALPALSLTGDVATLTGVGATAGFADVFAHQLRHFAEPRDIALGVSPDGDCAGVPQGLRTARDMGLLTVALLGGDGGAVAEAGVADHQVVVASDDPRVVKEVHVTAYHVLWELVHVFLEQPAVLGVDHCRGSHCVTCSDEAVPVRVVRLLGGDLADVDVGGGRTEVVSVALVDAGVGDVVLVHAKEAIGLVP